MKTSTAVLLALGIALLVPAQVRNHAQGATRTFTVDTTEITTPSVAVSPDGQRLIIGALGHLHQLAVSGGATTQLTFGPSYDSDPAISPDGRRVAFTSNRDGSGSNVFVLDLTTKRVTQISHDEESGRPAWSPDGRTIAYARNIAREDHPLELVPGFSDTGLREVMTVSAAGGAATAMTKPQAFETIFFLPDGRLGWTVRDLGAGGMMGPNIRQARVEARNADGSIAVLATAAADFGRAILAPKGDGIFYSGRGGIQWLPFGPGATATAGPKTQDAGVRLAVTPDASAVYFGDRGQLWKAALPAGAAQRVPFTASMAMEVYPRVEKKWQAPPATSAPAALRPVLAPQLSPDGQRIAVMAGGFVFEQAVSGGVSRKLFDDGAFSRDPAYSPDGTRLAYVASENGKRTLRIHDLGTKQSKVVFTTGGAAWPLYPSWSPDGTRVVFQHAQNLGNPFPIVIVDVADGKTETLTQTTGSWVARPHFSGDGRWVYFTNRPGKIAALYRMAPKAGATPEVLTDLTRHVHEGLVSPDGKWLAYRRNSEIWIASMGAPPIRDAAIRRVSTEGGRSFSFAPDSSAVAYTVDGKVYRQPIGGGQRVEIPVRVSVPRAVAPPLLISKVKVLDLATGTFSGDTSMYVEGGRIRWIGAERGRIPANAVRVDGGGRFAIPGLFDAHVHSAWENQQTNEDAFIAFGVTSVRDVGSTVDLLTALDDRSDATALPAPHYFYSGEIFEGLMPLWGDAFSTIGTEPEARAEVRRLKSAGADFVKIYPSLPWKLQGIVSDEARRVGLPIVGHGLSLEEVTRRVIWGSTSIEHGNAVTGSYGDLHKMLAGAGTVADLTLSVFNGELATVSDPEWTRNWRVLEYVPAEVRNTGGGGRGRRGGGPPATRESLLAQNKGSFDRLMSARGVGTTMAGGTDSLMGGVYFGLSLHWEIAQFADAGMAPIDVLRMATEGGAKVVGASADLGSLTPGKIADIVLLDESPLVNIRNTQKIWQVVKSGRLHDPARLRPGINVPASR